MPNDDGPLPTCVLRDNWGQGGRKNSVQRFSTFSIRITNYILHHRIEKWSNYQYQFVCISKKLRVVMSFKNQDSDSRECQWLSMWQIAVWSQQTYLSGQIFRVGVGQMGKSETSGHSNWKKTSSASRTTTGQLANKDQANKKIKQNKTISFIQARFFNPKFHPKKCIFSNFC